MAAKAHDAQQRLRLVEAIQAAGTKAFDPAGSEPSRSKGTREFDDLLQRTKTLDVLKALNLLIRPGRTSPWLRTKLMQRLTLVPLRPDGVRATLEFVFSVHPSSTVKVSEAAVPQKTGANITHEALAMANNLLSNPPAAATPETWYSGIAPQLLVLLDGTAGPELVKAASYVIGFGILGRKSTGAHGTPGWKYLAEPVLHHIKPPKDFSSMMPTSADGITDLSKESILVSSSEIATALRRLQSLVVSHPVPSLSRRLLLPLVGQLWALASWPDVQPSVTETVCTPAMELLKIILKLEPSADLVVYLARNAGYSGGYDTSSPEWLYRMSKDGQIQIVVGRQPLANAAKSAPRMSFQALDHKVAKLLDVVSSTLSDADISSGFLELLKRWLKSAGHTKIESIMVKQEEGQDPFTQLAEIKTLQAMMERFSDKLAGQPKHILDLVSQVLPTAEDGTDGEDEVTGVALSLLNMVITVPGFQKSRVDPAVLTPIESSLDRLSKGSTDNARTASNLRLLLLYRDEIDPSSETTTTAPTDRQIEDRKTYRLAISYITQPDSPPPVRAEGLSLLAGLVTARSPILDIPGILVLLSTLLADTSSSSSSSSASSPSTSDDPYIHQHATRLYTLLATDHPRSVLRELTERFVDPRETQSLDARLRFAEALAQVIPRITSPPPPASSTSLQLSSSAAVVVAPAVEEACEALVAVAGRRGQRPRTEARRRREAEKKARKEREAREAWGGEVPDLDDSSEDDGDDDKDEKKKTEEEKEKEREQNEVLRRIVEGWSGARGEEDVRARASALSVLGTAVEADAAAVGKRVVVAAVDLCVAVLQLETGVEKGILRRAAVLFVLSFVRALEKARSEGKELGFGFGREAQEGVMRTLRYVADTDNDGLVVQHARDVAESLENWQVVRLLPTEGSQSAPTIRGGLERLAGLEIDPERSVATQDGSRPRPRIEEIE